MADNTGLCKTSAVLCFPRSGGSNVGQIANEVGKRLTTQNIGKRYRLTGIAYYTSDFAKKT
ncbi:MAG: hypothetical protein QXX20_07790 [Candidatus Thermoplasmatota archaeon]